MPRSWHRLSQPHVTHVFYAGTNIDTELHFGVCTLAEAVAHAVLVDHALAILEALLSSERLANAMCAALAALSVTFKPWPKVG